jgi:hypothetical protein
MPFYSCAICQEDGTVVERGVKAAIELTEAGGSAEWYGTITVSHLTRLDAGQRYRLVLEDGRAAEFLVRRNTFAGGSDRAVAIRGMGPLR